MSSANNTKKRPVSKKISKRRSRRAAVKIFFTLSGIILASLTFLAMSPNRTDASSSASKSRNKYYTCVFVDYGDTLWNIAGEYCTYEYCDYYEYINEVMQINNLKSSNIKSGSRLCIPYYTDEARV